ncbi:MAG: outer membrane lipoprotein chaperone LolA [Gammaproteobacteria bacterium]|nr:MAG: outer membrane lipoprotein chaperone LolA [Gammaproteobacteria bacterium]
MLTRLLTPMVTLGLVTLLGASAAMPAAGAYADEAGAALGERLAAIRQFEARFTQTVFGARGEVLQNAEGRLAIERPWRFRWEVDAPYPQLIVTVSGPDGERIYIHDPDLDQVTIRSLDDSLSGTPAMILAGDPDQIAIQFEVSRRDTDGGELFELTPRDVRSLYDRLHLIFGAEHLERIEILDSFGQMTQVSFSDVTLNEPIDPARFSFEIPAGAEVIDDVGDAAIH